MPWLLQQPRCHEDLLLLVVMIILRCNLINQNLWRQLYRWSQNLHGFLNQIWLLIELISIFVLVIMELGAVVGCAEVAAEFVLRTPWPRLSSLSLIRCHGRCFVGNHHTRWCLLEAAELALQRDVSGLRIHDGLSDLQSLIKFKRRLLLDSINH